LVDEEPPKALRITDPAWGLIIGEELAREIGEEVAKRIAPLRPEIIVPPPPAPVTPVTPPTPAPAEREARPRTETVDWADINVETVQTFLDLTGRGVLRELVLRSTSNSYSVVLTVDNVAILSRSFEQLDAISEATRYLDAYESDGTYVLRILDIRFKNTLKFVVVPEESLTFSNMFALYDLYE